MSIVNWFLARIEEPSTWAGTGLIALGLHAVAPSVASQVLAVGSAVGGILAVALPEKKK